MIRRFKIIILGAVIFLMSLWGFKAKQVPEHYEVSGQVSLAQSTSKVIFWFSDIQNWPKWIPWGKSDASFRWFIESAQKDQIEFLSNEKQKGRLRISAIPAESRIEFQWTFDGDDRVTQGQIQLIPQIPDQTELRWKILGKNSIRDRFFWVWFDYGNFLKQEFDGAFQNLQKVIQ